MKKFCSTVAMAAVMFLSAARTTFAGQWIQGVAGWKHQKDDASFHVNNWQWVDNKCYYFMPEGCCLLNTTTPDGFTVDTSGAWMVNGVIQLRQVTLQEGWNQLGDVWKYHTNNEYMTSAWRAVDGKHYYFDESGNMMTGFRNVNGEKYYFSSDGSLVTASFTLDGMRYVVSSTRVITGKIDEFNWFSGNYSSTTYDSGNSNSDDRSSYAERVFEIVNKNRRAASMKELEWDDILASCVAECAYELQDRVSRTRPDGSKWSAILEETGVSYSKSGENIVSGQTSAKAVMIAWMRSTGHENNIINTGYKRTGVDCVYINETYYWVQLFTD